MTSFRTIRTISERTLSNIQFRFSNLERRDQNIRHNRPSFFSTFLSEITRPPVEFYGQIEIFSEAFNSDYAIHPIHNGVSDEILEKLKESACYFNKKKHGKNTICVICQEKVRKKSKLISCSGCKQSFCAGTDDNCKGIIFHAKINKYCPCCRKNIEDWDFKIDNQSITDSIITSSIIHKYNKDEILYSDNKYKNKQERAKNSKSRYKNDPRRKIKYNRQNIFHR